MHAAGRCIGLLMAAPVSVQRSKTASSSAAHASDRKNKLNVWMTNSIFANGLVDPTQFRDGAARDIHELQNELGLVIPSEDKDEELLP